MTWTLPYFSSHLITTCLLVGGLGSSLIGADSGIEQYTSDVAFCDVRVGYGSAARSASISSTSNSTGKNQDSSFTWDSTGRLSLLVLPPPGKASDTARGLWGFEAATVRNHDDGGQGGQSLDLRQLQLLIHLGVGWMASQRTTIELTTFGGPSVAWQVGGSRGSLGDGWQVGLRLGAAYTWDQGFQIHGGLLALYDQAQLTLESSGESWSSKLTERGVAPTIGLGWRF